MNPGNLWQPPLEPQAADVVELADARDLGILNQQFQGVSTLPLYTHTNSANTGSYSLFAGPAGAEGFKGESGTRSKVVESGLPLFQQRQHIIERWWLAGEHFLHPRAIALPQAGDHCLQKLRWMYKRRNAEEAGRDLTQWLDQCSGKCHDH
ncbi:MAG TPA: hypothetical protein PLC99_09545 [Verrucomicrobiota bacterium]|nr:hypothetical protein [Verrucomicrobiota bacterium]